MLGIFLGAWGLEDQAASGYPMGSLDIFDIPEPNICLYEDIFGWEPLRMGVEGGRREVHR